MALSVTHLKVNDIPSWTQPELDAQIALGFYPPGTTLDDITLPSDWNDPHVISGTIEQSQNNVAVDGVTITGNGTPGNPLVAASSSSFNTATAQVDFGFLSGQENNIATVTVSASWVTTSSVIICSPLATATTDHDPDDYAAEGIKAYATNIVNGVGFDIVVVADYATFGKYNINAIGV